MNPPAPDPNAPVVTDPTRSDPGPRLDFVTLDKRIANAKAFAWPENLAAPDYSDKAVAEAIEAADLLVGQTKIIGDASIAAYKRVMDDFTANVRLDLLDEKSQERVTRAAQERAQSEAKKARDEQEKILEGHREYQERRLALVESQLNGLLNIAPSEAALLAISTPLNAERARHAEMLRNCSVPEPTTWALYSLHHPQDRPLAAAVCNALSALGKSAPISPNDFAKRIVRDAHAKIVLARDQVADKRASLQAQRRAAERGFLTTVDRIQSGLRGANIARTKAAMGN